MALDAAIGDADAAQTDGSSDGGGGGGSTGAVGIIELSQSSANLWDLSADFTTGPSPCVTTMTGACYFTVCTTPAPAGRRGDGFSGSGPRARRGRYYGHRRARRWPCNPYLRSDRRRGGSEGYLPVSANALFLDGGDMVSASGAGGANLPAFGPQTVVAPDDDIVLTSPACTAGSCAPLNRTSNLAVLGQAEASGSCRHFSNRS